MSVGIILLCHTALDRAAEAARFWAASGAPVVIHVDRRTADPEMEAFRAALDGVPGIAFSPRFACPWGTFGLVEATLTAAGQLMRTHPGLDHVYLASGACLPLRPLSDLQDYLAAHPDTDFIESVTTDDVPWIVDGLAMERFTLRFPFTWQTQRTLFDGYVRLQRRLGLRRRIPQGLVPHLGSQWWCLTRRTLLSILSDPRRAEFDRYFRRVWIPDESYFQTLARLYSTRIESRSLTLSKFDVKGRPYTFYDDHLQLLRRSDCFVARKIWPQAGRLYRAFLHAGPTGAAQADPQPGKIDRLFDKAVERRRMGRAGLYMQSRFPAQDRENGKTGAPYSVFHGFSDLFEHFDGWLAKTAGGRVHGHLFAADRVEFAGNEPVFNGALSSSAALRDYDPRAFLTNLIWATRGERQCFQFSPRDGQECNRFIATDANAQISVISGAWAIPLFHGDGSFADIRAEAARLQRIETAHLALLRGAAVKARVRIWPLAEFLEGPMENLQLILDEISPRMPRRLSEAPRMVALDGFGQFLQNLKNQGMQPTLTGDFPVSRDWRPQPPARGRPYLVR
ncbi:MAG: glycosyl transferase [Proteobacteria bacterium]|nr:glycosyl transferase [Pseudomonadota bacterium]MBS0574026.1 glycosyl transferase [Pseudomonadota bacterium]